MPLPDSIPAPRRRGRSASRSPRIGPAATGHSFAAMTAQERARLGSRCNGVIAGLHVAGFRHLVRVRGPFALPEARGWGVAVLAYTLGLRHAFDADHISAIDNCTRKVLGERQDTGAPAPAGVRGSSSPSDTPPSWSPSGPGSSVAEKKTVFGRGLGQRLGARAVRGPVRHRRPRRAFLLMIGLLKPAGPGRDRPGLRLDAPRRVRRGRSWSASWPTAGSSTGSSARWMKVITKEWQLYPVGVVFGLGFDTATEGRPAGHHRAAGLPAHPLVRDHLPAGPVHRGA